MCIGKQLVYLRLTCSFITNQPCHPLHMEMYLTRGVITIHRQYKVFHLCSKKACMLFSML